MRTRLFILCLLVFTGFLCSAQGSDRKQNPSGAANKQVLPVVVDWINNPFYPVPRITTANHLKLRGPVKSMKETVYRSNPTEIADKVYQFKPNGLLTNETYLVNNKVRRETTVRDTVRPQTPNSLELEYRSTSNGKTDTTYIRYLFGLIRVEEKTGSFTVFEHDANKRLVSGISNKNKYDTAGYQYNKDGQLTQIIKHYENKKDTQILFYNKTISSAAILRKSDYTYTREKDHWIAAETYFTPGVGIIPKVYTFDANGNLIKNVMDKGETVIEYTYRFDKQGNWTSMIETTTKNGVSVKAEKFRELQYYE